MPEIHDQPDVNPEFFDNTPVDEPFEASAADTDADADMLCPPDYRDDGGDEGYDDTSYMDNQEHVSVTDRTFTGTLVHEDGSEEPFDLPEDTVDALNNLWTTQADAIYDGFTQDREGLDVPRAKAFVESLGVTATDRMVIVPRADKAALEEALIPIEGKQVVNPTVGGWYVSKSDTVIVYREQDMEAVNGTGYTESKLVHELLHSGGLVQIDLRTENKGSSEVGTAQMGYKRGVYEGMEFQYVTGDFIEEGFVQYTAGLYVVNKLDQPNGFAGLRGSPHITYDDAVGHLAIPLQHTFRYPEGDVGIHTEAIAARAIGHLIDRDPALLPALVAGARDNEALAEVHGRMNAISPGMFERLRDYYNKGAWYGQGLAYVCAKLDIPLDRLQ